MTLLGHFFLAVNTEAKQEPRGHPQRCKITQMPEVDRAKGAMKQVLKSKKIKFYDVLIEKKCSPLRSLLLLVAGIPPKKVKLGFLAGVPKNLQVSPGFAGPTTKLDFKSHVNGRVFPI